MTVKPIRLFTYITLFLLAAANAPAVVLDASFDTLRCSTGTMYQPWLDGRNRCRLPDGSILHASALMEGNRRIYDRETNTSVLNPDLLYAVIEYPGEGVYYGMVQASPTKGIANGCRLLGGRFVSPDGVNKFSVGRTPAQWKKQALKNPTGSYTFHTYKNGFDGESDRQDLRITYTFNPAGTFTASFGKYFTDYASQEIAGETTTRKRVGGRTRSKTTTQLTGGWYFDIDAKATCSGKWTLKGDTLTLRFTGKPKYNVTSKFNKQKLIDQWKHEDDLRFQDFKLDTYRRQYLAQAQADYPNHTVAEAKGYATDYLKEQFANFDRLTYIVYYLTANDLLMKSTDGTRVMSFQKKPSYDTWYDYDEHKVALMAAYHKWDKLSEYIIKNRNERIVAQLADMPRLGSAGDIYLYNLSDDEKSADMLAFPEAGGRPAPRLYPVRFNGNVVEVDFENGTPYTAVDDLIAEMNANETILQANAADKKAKALNKAAKRYFKITGKKTVDSSYNSLQSFFAVTKAVQERLELQQRYLEEPPK